MADWLAAEGVNQVVMEAHRAVLGSRAGGCWMSAGSDHAHLGVKSVLFSGLSAFFVAAHQLL